MEWRFGVALWFDSVLAVLHGRNGEGQSSHVPVFCVNFEQHRSVQKKFWLLKAV